MHAPYKPPASYWGGHAESCAGCRDHGGQHRAHPRARAAGPGPDPTRAHPRARTKWGDAVELSFVPEDADAHAPTKKQAEHKQPSGHSGRKGTASATKAHLLPMETKKMNCSGQGMLHEQKHNLEWGADLTPERYNLPILAQEQ